MRKNCPCCTIITIVKVDEEGIDPKDYLSIGDYEIDSSYSKNQLAALALTAHTILNLDETITRG